MIQFSCFLLYQYIKQNNYYFYLNRDYNIMMKLLYYIIKAKGFLSVYNLLKLVSIPSLCFILVKSIFLFINYYSGHVN